MRKRPTTSRTGAVLVLLLVTIITLFAFVALAIDLGMLAVARTQLQDAADISAMAGTRTLNGDMAANNNYGSAAPNAITAATVNHVLSKPISSGQVNVQIGRYVYKSGPKRFEGEIPGPSTENWSMVTSQISSNVTNNLAFAKVFNFGSTNMQATATAVHRPRDVAVVLDYSGSMRYGSLLGEGPSSNPRTSNNPDSIVPQFGHYSSIASAGLQATSFTNPYDPANITITTSDGRPPIVNDFYRDAGGTPAFVAASTGYMTTPGGDNFLKSNLNSGAGYCTTAANLLNLGSAGTSTRDINFESQGYAAYGMSTPTVGHTEGPGYWGKTFFMWPPDPTNDWRKLYFTYGNSNTPMDDNSELWDSSGHWRAPGGSTYSINYTAILDFIKNKGPNPFPPRLQSGRILYYDAIPNSINTSSFPPTDMNERFWKDYIDNCLGLVQTGSNSWTVITDGNDGRTGYGSDYAFGTVRITAKSSLTGNPKPYMHYLDNPLRPRTHFWFGPMTMVDFLGNYNLWGVVTPTNSRFCWWPGTCHESPMYPCKLGIRAALNDIETNHPNNLVSLIMFSVPRSSANNSSDRFNRVRVGLGRNYPRMQEALWYPPKTLGNGNMLVRPYDSENIEVPRANGGTCYSMGLMLAYNQFSTNTSLLNFNPAEPAGDAGGNGRRGAQKMVIFETDGAPNRTASASFQNNGAHLSYYGIRYNSANPSASEFPSGINSYQDNSSTVTSQVYGLCSRISALENASPSGYSTPSKKALIHCIGFGPVFAPGSSSRAAALATLNQMQTLGNVTDGMPEFKIVYGSESQMVDKLQQAFTQILQSGVQVSLLH